MGPPRSLSVRHRSDLQIPAWFLTPGQSHPGCPIGILEVEPRETRVAVPVLTGQPVLTHGQTPRHLVAFGRRQVITLF